MIIVTVYLASAIDDSHSKELARMIISNTGEGEPHHNRHNYIAEVMLGRSKEALDRRTVHKRTTISNWPRDARHVWNLVAVALRSMRYGDTDAPEKQT